MTSGTTGTPGSGGPPADDRLAWHTLGTDQVLHSEGVDGQRGLSSAEAATRAERFGPNTFAAGQAESRWHAFFRQYRDPMQLVLLAAGIGSLYPLKQLGTGILLILLTLFNAVEGLHQEGKATAAVSALQKMVIIKARVRRDGQLAEVPAERLVPGDIVAIEAGDIVPADGRLLRAATLEIAESALTGESLPVSKGTEPVAGADTPLGDRTDMVYMNTNVTRGSAEFVGTATGMATEDPTEGALVVLAAKGGIDAVSTRQAYPRIAELPFDAAYKLTATFHTMTDSSGAEVVRCFVKGAPDQLLARAATVFAADAGPVPADGRFRELYLAENQRLGEQGLRVMATARKDFDPAAFDPGADLLPLVDGLELLALVGIVDPPRPTAKDSIATAKKAGIRIRMITGDHAVTAAAIARQLGIDGTVITGAEFGAMSDDEALDRIDEVGVIARVTPEHKVRLVDMLKRQGHIVAMTGDGVNDAPALKKADIGIAMGETGTEVAKQAAVMVLTDDNFSTITKAVEIGRGLYDNLVRYIRFEMGCMFGFIITF